MNKKNYNEEIDLIDLIIGFWNNKIKITVITASFIILGFLYFHSLEKKFLATTNIKPISTFESQEYRLFNVLAGEKIVNINSESLFNLFLDKIQTTEIIEEAIINFDIIKKDKFENQEIYLEEIEKTAILIIDKILPPLNDGKNKVKNNLYWQYNFKISNKTNWKFFLQYLENRANEEIRLSLIDRFNTEIEILETNSKFKIEDIEQDIENALDDYKSSIGNRLAFLEEQAKIARTLNIAKNTLESENFQTDYTIVTNIKSENSYYLKGYEMIEKEISLIKSRENEKAFILNLLDLEKNKRSILQDKQVERLKLLFLETPINNKNKFKAGRIDYVATKYKKEVSLSKIIVISTMLGFLISLIYIAFNSIIARRK